MTYIKCNLNQIVPKGFDDTEAIIAEKNFQKRYNSVFTIAKTAVWVEL